MKDVKGKGMAMFALPFVSVISHVYLSYVSSISLLFFFLNFGFLRIVIGCSFLVHVFYLLLYFLFIPFFWGGSSAYMWLISLLICI